MKKLFGTLMLVILLLSQVSAQNDAAENIDDGRGVVVAVLVLIFAGLFLFLLATERKLSRMEKHIKDQ